MITHQSPLVGDGRGKTVQSATELKQIFQEGWNVPARVDNYVRNVAEFTEGECHLAWRKTLAAALSSADRLKILDVGTGPGIFACLYSQMGHECVGLDFSERMLDVARLRAVDLKLDCSFVFGDAEAPPLADAAFDVVSSRHLLFNLPHPGVAIREWVRMLMPGGRMILIGNEHLQQPPQSLAARSKQLLRRCLGRPARRRVPGWNPGPDYLDAVSQCPLFKHGEGTLRAVMEAAGLQETHSIATDDIDRARRQDPKKYLRRDFPSRFFILVGIKPQFCRAS